MAQTSIHENLNLGNYMKAILPDSCPETFPVHWHKQIELLYLPDTAQITESPIIEIGSKKYHLKSGDLLMIWAGELHSIVSNHTKQLCGLQFSPSLILDLPDFAPFIHAFQKQAIFHYNENPGIMQDLMENLGKITELFFTNIPFSHVTQTIYLLKSFINISDYINAKQHKKKSFTAPSSSNTLKIQEACIYISENFEKNLILPEVASQFGFGTSYFSKLFKKVTSYHYVDYLYLQRLKYAQLLLSDFTLSITEIAYKAGFKSISSFNRIFLEHFDLSPSKYRKLYSTSNHGIL